MNKDRTPEEQAAISRYMSQLGKKGGAKNKAKGSDYFKWVRSIGVKKQLEEKKDATTNS